MENYSYQNEHQDVYKNNDGLSRLLSNVFIWLFAGLTITAITAFLVYSTGLWLSIIVNTGGIMVIIIAQLALVVILSRGIHKLSFVASMLMFIVYSVLTGVTFSTLGAIYDASSIYLAFGISAALFGSLAVIGHTTSVDLTKFGPILYTGLILLVIVSVIGIFINLSAFSMMINALGLAIFMGLTAYDIQKIKKLYYANINNQAILKNLYILGALELYLDFINIFIRILRIVGRRD